MVRFFVESSQIGEGTITLSQSDLQHIRALRLGAAERFTVCDGSGTDYICTLSQIAGVAVIDHSKPTLGEPRERCRVFAAFSKGERMEYVIQKSVELGAYELIAFPAARCVAKYDSKSAARKLERWNKISLEAAKQCGRGTVPRVRAAESYTDAIDEAAQSALPLFLYELEDTLSLRAALKKAEGLAEVSIVTGPEGGFDGDEVRYAHENGMEIITLGKRILRCETAPVAALAAIMYHTGNF